MNDNDIKNVIKEVHDEDGPFVTGEAFCLQCQHEWVATSPVGTTSLECPECKTNKGLIKFECCVDEDHWICNCKNSYFCITPNRVYCPNCGNDQYPYD